MIRKATVLDSQSTLTDIACIVELPSGERAMVLANVYRVLKADDVNSLAEIITEYKKDSQDTVAAALGNK